MVDPDIIYHDNFPWMYTYQLQFDKKIEIYSNNLAVRLTSLPKILCIVNEPAPTRPIQTCNEYVIRDHSKFKFILSHDPEILAKCKNAVFMPYGTTWISPHQFGGEQPKLDKISFLCGHKTQTDGHKFRQELWYRQRDIKYPKMFYISSTGGVKPIDNNPTLSPEWSAKNELMKCKYHICIENIMIDNYFSEKIIDAFVTRTVPIYRGCTNIGNFFNTKGILEFRTISDLIVITNTLIRTDLYSQMLPYIEDNYNRCLQYCENVGKRVESKIRENWYRLS